MNRKAIIDRLDELGYDPIEEMVAIASDPLTPRDERARLASDLAGYCYPKMKSVEVSGPGGESLFAQLSPTERAQRVLAMVRTASSLALVASVESDDERPPAAIAG